MPKIDLDAIPTISRGRVNPGAGPGRHPSSHPVLRSGEWGQRACIRSGSMVGP